MLLLGQLGRESGTEGPLPVCLAGRGTLWLQRLSSGLKERLMAYLRPAAGTASAPPPVVSAAPKQEVAQGLLTQLDLEGYSVTHPLHLVVLKNSLEYERVMDFYRRCTQPQPPEQ